MLSEKHFAATLLVVNLVRLKKKLAGGYTVMSSKYTDWDYFFDGNNLTKKDGGLGIVEVTQSKVYIDAFKRRRRGTKLAGGDRKKMLKIRVGRYDKEGETSKASLQLKDGVRGSSPKNVIF